jgi:hypothetical protein
MAAKKDKTPKADKPKAKKKAKKGKGSEPEDSSEPENPKEDDLKIVGYSSRLTVKLTPEEQHQRAQASGHLFAKRDNFETKLKNWVSQQKAHLKEMDRELRALNAALRDGSEEQDVKCERRYNYTTRLVTEVRLDTGEVLSSRPMNGAESQKELFDPSTDIEDSFDMDAEAGAHPDFPEPPPSPDDEGDSGEPTPDTPPQGFAGAEDDQSETDPE